MPNDRKCSRCGAPRRAHQRYCGECHAGYMRRWRRQHAAAAFHVKTSPLVSLLPDEIAALVKWHALYCLEHIGASEWAAHSARAKELALLLEGTPLWEQLAVWEPA